MEKLKENTIDYIKGLFNREFDRICDILKKLQSLDETYRIDIESTIRYCEFKDEEESDEEYLEEVQGCREAIAEFEQEVRAVCESIKLPESRYCKGTDPGDMVDECFTQLTLLEDELRATYTDFYWKVVRADE